LTEMEPAAAASVERLLADIWTRGEGAGGGSAESAALSAAALSGWTLLQTVSESADCNVAVGRLATLLESAHLDVRVAAGEALAVLHEAQPLDQDLDQVIIDFFF
jgi:hypothetical protein